MHRERRTKAVVARLTKEAEAISIAMHSYLSGKKSLGVGSVIPCVLFKEERVHHAFGYIEKEY
jgi:hypothetical protein